MRKITSFIKRAKVYFYYTAKPRSINPIAFFRKKNEVKARIILEKIDDGRLLSYIEDISKKSDSTGCEYSDYITIWEFLIKHNPKNIIEFGSGISTVVFAYYVSKQSKNNDVNFVSMESVEKWKDQIVGIFPKELKEYVNFVHSIRRESLYNGIRGSHHQEIPDNNYDMLFIDGPGLRRVWKDKNSPKCFNSDIINILLKNKHSKINAILDQRIDTLWKLKKLIPGGRIDYDVVKKVSFFHGITADQLVKGLNVELSDEY